MLEESGHGFQLFPEHDLAIFAEPNPGFSVVQKLPGDEKVLYKIGAAYNGSHGVNPHAYVPGPSATGEAGCGRRASTT